jgi:hypothetical protein
MQEQAPWCAGQRGRSWVWGGCRPACRAGGGKCCLTAPSFPPMPAAQGAPGAAVRCPTEGFPEGPGAPREGLQVKGRQWPFGGPPGTAVGGGEPASHRREVKGAGAHRERARACTILSSRTWDRTRAGLGARSGPSEGRGAERRRDGRTRWETRRLSGTCPHAGLARAGDGAG